MTCTCDLTIGELLELYAELEAELELEAQLEAEGEAMILAFERLADDLAWERAQDADRD